MLESQGVQGPCFTHDPSRRFVPRLQTLGGAGWKSELPRTPKNPVVCFFLSPRNLQSPPPRMEGLILQESSPGRELGMLQENHQRARWSLGRGWGLGWGGAWDRGGAWDGVEPEMVAEQLH